MKKYIYFLHFLFMTATCCFAQRQITHFSNREDKQAFNPQYKAQVGNRMIFSSFSPANGNELWVSDGTKANTKLLKDIAPGYESSYSYDFCKFGELLYFVAGGYEIWKTDGSPAGTEKLLHSDSTLNLNIVSGKLLATFRNTNTQRYAFAWLNANGKTEFLNEDATTFQYSNGKLYYGLHDSTAKKWTLKVLDSEPHVLTSHLGPQLNEIIVEEQNGYEYIAVYAGYNEKKLIVAAANRSAGAKTYDWNLGPAPMMLRDKTGALFLINDGGFFNNNVTLKIFKVVEGEDWETVADVTTSMLYTGTPTGSNEGPFHTNFVIDGDQLTFTTLFGYESIYAAYLGVFDFKKNTKRISPSLPKEVTGRGVTITPQSRDVFEIRYANAQCTYDIVEKRATSLEQLPYGVQKVKVADLEFELSDNVYVASGKLRLPLIRRRPIYSTNLQVHRTVLNNKLLFWTNDHESGTGKLWVSDGKTTSELMSFDGQVVPWKMVNDSIRIGNQIVFSSSSQRGIRLFKTDGTRAGTRELYEYPAQEWTSVDKVIANNRMAVFEFNVAGKKVSLVSDLEKVWEIDHAKFGQGEFYATNNDIFMVHSSTSSTVYKIENGDLKPIELNKGGEATVNHLFHDNRIFYMLRNNAGQLHDICYTDAGSDKVNRLFTGPMNYLISKGDLLIAGTMSGPDVKIYKAGTAQLLGEFTDIHPVNVATGNAVALWSNRQVAIVHNDRIVSQRFTENIELVNAVPQGILVKLNGKAGNSWYVYDPKRGKMQELFKDRPIEFVMAGAGDQLLFSDSGNDRHQILWDLAGERRIDFPAGLVVTRPMLGNLAIVYDVTAAPAVYSVEGSEPVKKYELHNWYDSPPAGNGNYTTVSTIATGFELARIDRDSLYHFPEIIKGQESVFVTEVFDFKGSLYAVAFAYSRGLQVWKMDEMNLVPDDDDLVVTRPETPGRGGYLPDDALLNAYPNPVINELNIDLREGGLIRIIDPRGFEQLKTVAGKSTRLDVRKLPAGEYIIIYSGANGHVVKKIVKF